jgi:alkylhydroperoxidase family enzyme
MKRTTLVHYEDASPGVRAIYDHIMQTMGGEDVLNIFKALGNSETILQAVWSMMKGTLIDGEIPMVLKQLILFQISIHTGNRYCEALHAHTACNLDPTFTYDDLLSLSEGNDLDKLPASFQTAIEVVTKAALEPKSIEGDDFPFEEQLRDEGFSEPEIDELMAQAYCGVMLNQLIDVYDIPVDVPYPASIE